MNREQAIDVLIAHAVCCVKELSCEYCSFNATEKQPLKCDAWNNTTIKNCSSTDPIGGQLVNAFDLVRVQKFGGLDENVKPNTPTSKQIRFLESKGFQHVGTWQFDTAKKLIDRIAGNGWRIPRGMNPREYKGV